MIRLQRISCPPSIPYIIEYTFMFALSLIERLVSSFGMTSFGKNFELHSRIPMHTHSNSVNVQSIAGVNRVCTKYRIIKIKTK